MNTILHTKYFKVAGVFMAMFFFTTGYLIPLSLERCNGKQFAVKRFFRLAPVLWFAILICCIIFYHFGLVLYRGRTNITIQGIFSTMFCVNDIKWAIQDLLYGKHYRDNLIMVTWSMQVEIKYYIIVAISYALCKNNKRKSFFATIFFTILWLILAKLYKPYNRDFGEFTDSCIYILVILVGHIIYLLQRKIISKKEFLIFLFFIAVSFYSFTYLALWTSYSIGILICCIITLKKPSIGNNKIISVLADCTYSLYLFHHILLVDILYYFPSIYKNYTLRLLCLIPLTLFCYLIYKFIEKPLYQYGRKLASKIS